ncbi:hypothetical protein Tco_0600304 [Tanacetum coccineum]|uniref:Uncharacterized protein n=1 Tax=Tanacetum coccineum TaxID=301880 RepID=A0ABQ4WBK1_9ASTR
MFFTFCNWDVRWMIVEVKVPVLYSVNFEWSFQDIHDEVQRVSLLASSLHIAVTMMGVSCGEVRVKHAIWCLKNSDKSFSFIFFEISSALDSLFYLVPSSISCYKDMESLGADNLRSALAVDSAKASCPDADLECK